MPHMKPQLGDIVMKIDRQEIGDTLVRMLHGHGFVLLILTDEGMMQLTNFQLDALPDMLREVADGIEGDLSTSYTFHDLTVPS